MGCDAYVIGLGSNLGERRERLHLAARRIADVTPIVRASPLYETLPVGPPQPDFLNAALLVETSLQPLALLERLLGIERELGRERRERWGPRSIDLDILYGDGPPLRLPGLSVPHPELKVRPFALVPLLDVLPDARDPETGERYADVLARLDRTGVREAAAANSRWAE
jgi:2-amino-4-hydroxy-6-hydroxymethyldihydropteridine diphosphokinase